MKLREIVICYKTLGEAKVTKLSDADVVKIVKARKAMRPIADDFEAFLKDCQEKFKPEDWDKVQEKVQKWSELSEEEKLACNKVIIAYQKKLDEALVEEQDKDGELTLEKLDEGAESKLLLENGWEVKRLDEIALLL